MLLGVIEDTSGNKNVALVNGGSSDQISTCEGHGASLTWANKSYFIHDLFGNSIFITSHLPVNTSFVIQITAITIQMMYIWFLNIKFIDYFNSFDNNDTLK